jgi:C4-dicarboxylate-binding protein DctP
LDKLPADQRDALVTSAKEASKYQRELIEKAEAAHLETFKKAGLEILRLTPEQRAEFEKASQPVYDWYTAKFGSETLDLIRKSIKGN